MTSALAAAPVVSIRALACRRGERVLFEAFELDVAPGELVWLRAANGVGKTSLLRLVAGLAKPEAGTIERGGRPVLYLGHANALKEDLTVVESVRLFAAMHGLAPPDAAIDAAIRRVGLHGRRDAPIRTLSQGQRRRVAMTRLDLSSSRTLWLLDEPFDALDAAGVALVGDVLAEHAARGGSALFTSHIAPTIPATTPRIVRLDDAAG